MKDDLSICQWMRCQIDWDKEKKKINYAQNIRLYPSVDKIYFLGFICQMKRLIRDDDFLKLRTIDRLLFESLSD